MNNERNFRNCGALQSGKCKNREWFNAIIAITWTINSATNVPGSQNVRAPNIEASTWY